MRTYALVLSVALSGVLTSAARGADPVGQPRIFGGVEAENCQWPTAVAIRPGGGTLCSATLIHPRVILTAAHCIGTPPSVRFGETSSSPAKIVPIDWCIRNPDYTGNVGGTDFATCLLTSAAEGIPVTPVLMGCETDWLVEGQTAHIVGFGQTDGNVGAGSKRWVETSIALDAGQTEVIVGGDGKSSCFGDSGGPAYLQLPDQSWRAFGIVSGGPNCEDGGIYVTMHSTVEWVEQMTQLDVTPCHDPDGAWSPSEACGGFATDVFSTEPDWDGWCATPLSDSSSTCGPAFDDPADEEGPSVLILSPEDGDEYAESPVSLDVEVEADDGEGWGVVEVDLVIEDMVVATDGEAPWGFAEVAFPQGEWKIVARGRDWWGNVGESPPVSIQVGEAVPPDPEGTDDGETEEETESGQDPTDEGPTDGGSDGSTETDEPGPSAPPDGCGCQSVPAPTGIGFWLGLLALVRRRVRIRPCA